MELIIGAPRESTLLLLKPKTKKYDKIQVTTHEDMEGAISADGTRLWAWVYTDPIRLTQYNTNHAANPVSMHDISISTLNFNTAFLWIAVTENDLICVLTADNTTSADPLALTVLRRCPGDEILDIALVKSIERRHVMRSSVFMDEEENELFVRGSLQCFTWNDRTFIIMLSIHFKENISLLEVGEGASTEWKTWYIPCGTSQRIGCIKQIKNLIYIIPANAGRVFVIDVHLKDPYPLFIHLLPMIPNSVCRFGKQSQIQQVSVITMMEVSENGRNYIVNVTGTKQVLHLTETTSRPLDKKYQLNVDAISFIGNDAAICFTNSAKAYRLYNLRTKDFVRAFRFTYTPFFALMKNNCIWSIDTAMGVHRQTVDDDT
jgi:hypothetical protein